MTSNSIRSAIIGTALLAAILPLSPGTAGAESDLSISVTNAGPGTFDCVYTGVTCEISPRVTDYTTPITLSVDGTALGTITPTGCCSIPWLLWTPKTAGHHMVSAQQGTRTATLGVDIIDPNSLAGILRRLTPGSSH
ncbi:hypothetical protein AB0L82_28560 [Nocardia sp. NPDC052001]|uniref:hypothetical protein n=1 Tax=Nocardia sp. NPDC052001 TaxID=3154853 RepID=UPI003436DCBE